MNKSDNNENHEIDIISLLKRFLKNWYWFLLSSLLSLIIAWFFVQQNIPEYNVSGKLLVSKDENTPSLLSSAFGSNAALLGRDNLSLINEIEILKSPDLIQKAIERLSLNIRYFQEDRFRNIELYEDCPIHVFAKDSLGVLENLKFTIEDNNEEYKLIIQENSIDNELVEIENISGRYNQIISILDVQFKVVKNSDFTRPIIVQFDNALILSRSYSSKLQIEGIRQSDVLELSLNDTKPKRAIVFIDELVKVYNEVALEDKNRSTNNTLEFIDNRLLFIAQELFDVEREIEEYKNEIDIPIDISQGASNFLNTISSTDQSIAEFEIQISVLNEVSNRVKNNANLLTISFNLDGSTPLVMQDYNNLVKEKNKLLVGATDDNPLVIAINEQLNQARNGLIKWIDFKVDDLEQQKAYLEAQVDPMKSKLASFPKYEREIIQIMRQQVVKQTIFTFLLQKREETAMTLAAEINNAKIISNPVLNFKTSTSNLLIYSIFLLAGLFIPSSILFGVEYTDDKIYSKDEIEEYLQIPVLSEIMDAGEGSSLKVKKDVKSAVSELFRLLRTNLNIFLKNTSKSTAILVTSSTRGEGKSFISINLASSLALSGDSVVLVGLDLRKPTLAKYLQKTKPHFGVSNFLSDDNITIDDITNSVSEVDNLTWIDSGPIPPNPGEIILGDRLTILFEELKKKYKYIIVDSAPVGLVSDSFTLNKNIDVSLYIMKYGHTQKFHLNVLRDVIQSKKLENLNIIFNGVKNHKQINYSYGYYDNVKEKSFWEKLFNR